MKEYEFVLKVLRSCKTCDQVEYVAFWGYALMKRRVRLFKIIHYMDDLNKKCVEQKEYITKLNGVSI